MLGWGIGVELEVGREGRGRFTEDHYNLGFELVGSGELLEAQESEMGNFKKLSSDLWVALEAGRPL